MKFVLPMMAAALAAVTAPASAATFVFTGTLSGANEVPANSSTATGTFTATLDDVANSISVAITFAGLSANASAGHIHCCAAVTANAPVIVGFAGFPGATSGTYSNSFTGISVTNVNGIKAGLSYINIHSQQFPGGEIRGQLAAVSAVPEVATWGMMIVGFGMVGGTLRMRRRVTATA
jgi:CHRD domain